MKIQNLLLPEVGVCSEQNLFYRTSHPQDIECDMLNKKLVFLKKRAKCDFSTYFNGLSIAKWKKYTQIGNVSLNLKLFGKFEVILKADSKSGKNLSSSIVNCVRVEGDGVTPISLPYVIYDYRGMLSFSLYALEDEAVFLGGWYEAQVDEEQLREVDLAINICTFKRELFVERNIKLLSENILNNKYSELSEHLQVFISDNGHTLPVDSLSSEKIHIVSNKNVGGAGGFSRGMMEIMKYAENHPVTHVIMMDDDIVIQTESLFRTYELLRCRKDIYEDMFIGGAMLRLDHQEIQVESGASWNAGRLVANKSGLNLSSLEACLYNEVEEYAEYNAWWYCCTPMLVIKPENLPLPIFIRGDDLEYGLRNMKTLVLMNGICVWHEPFENKYSSFLQYYILRNMLYDNALHFSKYNKFKFLKRLWGNAARELVYYRYKSVELMVRGVKDYYKGVDFLLNTDGEKLHKEIMDAGYKAEPIENLGYAFHYPEYDRSFVEVDQTPLHKVVRYLLLNGYLLPAKKQGVREAKCVSMACCRPVNFYRQKHVLNYDAMSGKAFMTCKSYKALFKCLAMLISVTLETIKSFDSAGKEFRENSWRIQSVEFWKKYLA